MLKDQIKRFIHDLRTPLASIELGNKFIIDSLQQNDTLALEEIKEMLDTLRNTSSEVREINLQLDNLSMLLKNTP